MFTLPHNKAVINSYSTFRQKKEMYTVILKENVCVCVCNTSGIQNQRQSQGIATDIDMAACRTGVGFFRRKRVEREARVACAGP